MIIQVNSPVEFVEVVPGGFYYIITQDAETELIGSVYWCTTSKGWFLGIRKRYLLGSRTMQQIMAATINLQCSPTTRKV